MDPATIAGLAGAGASLVGGLVNNAWADARTDKQFKRMNEMQDKMNAYNAPVAQMARLREAGLNPNLVYANGGAVIQSAVGNAPQPANTAPIDTQGVLQMVQTIVGAMLEKDKIQAQKDVTAMQTQSNEKVAEGHDTTQKEVTGMQTKSNENIATERNTTEKEMNTDRINSTEKIADANRKENARQFNLSFAHQVSVDNARIAIDRSLANSTIALHSSQIRVNELSAQLSESVQPYLVDKAKYESLSLAFSYGNDVLNQFLSLPQYIGEGELGAVFDKAGLPRPAGYQLKTIADFHNAQFEVWNKVNVADARRADAAAWYANWNAFWGAASTPIKLGVAVATMK